MKLRKSYIIIIVGIVLLTFLSVNVVAIDDATGDIWHYQAEETSTLPYEWIQYGEEKPNIDIIDLSYIITGSEVTLTMTVNGMMEYSLVTTYKMYLECNEGTYEVHYANGNAGWYANAGSDENFDFVTAPVTNVSNNTYTSTFQIANPDIEYALWGYAKEFASPGSTEKWADYASDAYAPWYEEDSTDETGEDDTIDNTGDDEPESDTSTGTPGFETILVILALGIALIILRRKN